MLLAKNIKKKILFFELDYLLLNLKSFFVIGYDYLNSSDFFLCREKNYSYVFKFVKKSIFKKYSHLISFDFFFNSKVIICYTNNTTSSVDILGFLSSFEVFKSLRLLCFSYYNFFFSRDLILWISSHWSIFFILQFLLSFSIFQFFSSRLSNFFIFCR